MESKTTYIIIGFVAIIAFIIIAGVIISDDGKEKNTTNTSNSSNNSATNSTSNSTESSTDDDSFDYESAAEEQMAEPKAGENIAVMHVKNYGDITFKFFEDKAPKAVENFLTHAKEGY